MILITFFCKRHTLLLLVEFSKNFILYGRFVSISFQYSFLFGFVCVWLCARIILTPFYTFLPTYCIIICCFIFMCNKLFLKQWVMGMSFLHFSVCANNLLYFLSLRRMTTVMLLLTASRVELGSCAFLVLKSFITDLSYVIL